MDFFTNPKLTIPKHVQSVVLITLLIITIFLSYQSCIPMHNVNCVYRARPKLHQVVLYPVINTAQQSSL